MQERSGVAAMALGIIEECLSLSIAYAKDRVQFGEPIGNFQLIQDKLARMEVARLNVENLVFRTIEMSAAGHSMTLAEASAMKLYSARAATEVALEAVQIFGGNGYMSEFRVEQLARDSKVLQIYAGTDEIQITHIAKDLLRRLATHEVLHHRHPVSPPPLSSRRWRPVADGARLPDQFGFSGSRMGVRDRERDVGQVPGRACGAWTLRSAVGPRRSATCDGASPAGSTAGRP